MEAKKKTGPSFGPQAVAEMLNYLDSESRGRLLRTLAEKDPAAFAEVRDRMFSFDDIAQFVDEDLRELLKKIPQAKLALAMRNASEAFKAALFRNMSKVGAENLTTMIADLGPQKLSLVEATQREIIAVAKTLNSGRKDLKQETQINLKK